ncbi:Aldo/keto reductase [Athelia psychrophila]|uniref:Aldo/keto reductase n=1 Tax=Athelia psychrophila TaxID=1759441 RepID=A0A166WJZ7_9AGAM|nr:Aldo/keto reductase [Fibularhizoctonia sp. CBS 109695]
MPWDTIKLNDGNKVPSIAFGTWKRGNGQESVDLVDLALSTGFDHIDTAQAYRNEREAGIAIRESGLKRDEIFVTTKYSGYDGLDVSTAIRNSLENLGLTYVDLYLIHHPSLAKPDIPTAWKEFEKLKEDGHAKSIGVSNFSVADLTILINSAKVVPAVNQIMVQPYVWAKTAPIVEFGNKHGIFTEAYSPLYSLTSQPGGPVDAPVNLIAARLQVTPEQVLLAWAREKVAGGIVITSTTKKERMEGYLNAGDILLTAADVQAIDAAGALGSKSLPRKVAERAGTLVAVWLGLYGLMAWSGLALEY